ncbi:ATP-binding protein [Actinomycetospora sp. C-140]
MTDLEEALVISPLPPENRGPVVLRDVEVRVLAVPEALVTVRTVAGDLAARAEFPLDTVDDLKLAVDEACICLADIARPDTRLTGTFSVDEDGITMTVSVSTLGPISLPTDTFAWRVLTVLADDVRVLAEAPTEPGGAHRLALRMTLERPELVPRGDTGVADDAEDLAVVASFPERPGAPAP